RVVFDPALVAWLAASPGAARETRWGRVLEDVLPRRSGRSVVWAVVPTEEEVVRYSPALSGCRLVTVEQAFDLGVDALWSVAMVDVRPEPRSSSGEGAASGPLRCSPALTGMIERFVEELGRGRTLCVSVTPAGIDVSDEEEVADFLDMLVPDSERYVLAKPTVAAVYALGEDAEEQEEDPYEDEDDDDDDDEIEPWPDARARTVRSPWMRRARVEESAPQRDYDADLADAEESWTGEWHGRFARPQTPRSPGMNATPGDERGSEGIGIGYDNRLGDEVPEAHAWMAVLGRTAQVDEMTLVDLGAAAPTPSTSNQRESEHPERRRGQSQDSSQVRELKARLNQARLRADAAVIEHQRLTEVVHTLQQQAQEEAPAPVDVAVLEAELASARWNLEQANEQVEALRGRPVTELEAMIFSLRAQLGDAIEGAPTARPRPPASTVIKVARDRGVPTAPDVTAQRQRAVEDAGSAAAASSAHRGRERAAVKSLLRKLERGGGSALEFHAELRALLSLLERGRG
ncbi:MAG: hypothetical protein ACPHRO_07960, partial [Nannocystaceae bacterium]